MLFDWLKRSVKNAVLDGVNEAIAELSGASPAAVPALPQVRLRLTGPVEEEEPEEVAGSKGRRQKG